MDFGTMNVPVGYTFDFSNVMSDAMQNAQTNNFAGVPYVGGFDDGQLTDDEQRETINQRLNQLGNIAFNAYAKPFQPYVDADGNPIDRIAGFTDEQNALMQGRRDQFNALFAPGDDGAAQFDPRGDLYGRMDNFNYANLTGGGFVTGDPAADAANLAAYQNPYTTQVLNAALSEIDRDTKLDLQANRDAAINAGAFDNTRLDVQQGIRQAEGDRNRAAMTAQIMADAYRQARTDQAADLNRMTERERFDRTTGLDFANAGNTYAALQVQDMDNQFNQLANFADLGQQMNQSNLDLDYADFLSEQDFGRQNVAELYGLLAGTPIPGRVVENGAGQPSAYDRMLGGLSGASTGAGLAAALGVGAMPLAIGGGLLGLLG